MRAGHHKLPGIDRITNLETADYYMFVMSYMYLPVLLFFLRPLIKVLLHTSRADLGFLHMSISAGEAPVVL